ncbi:MAG: hypothetical protein ABL916_11460 [Burkholderiaceae bacterium]
MTSISKTSVVALCRSVLTTLEYNALAVRAELSELETTQEGDEVGLLQRQAYALYHAGFDDQARAAFNALVALAPHPDSLTKLAQLELRQGRAAASLDAAEAAIAMSADHHLATQTRAAALLALGRGREALEAANVAMGLADDPRSAALVRLAAARVGMSVAHQAEESSLLTLAQSIVDGSLRAIDLEGATVLISRMEAFAAPLPRLRR